MDLFIERWTPATLNSLMEGHWAKGAKKKKFDRDMVCGYVTAKRLPKAERRRRVSLLLILPPGKRRPDRDAFWKSTLDACVHAGLLVQDSPNWCEQGYVAFARAEGKDRWGTLIQLEDI